MKKLSLLFVLLLVACTQQAGTPQDASQAEIQMAEMMGITVEELRNQTPEEHMQMMQELMMRENAVSESEDLSSLPEVKPTEVLDVQDGDRISLVPTKVRMKIGNKEVAMFGYNGQIPGPTIRAPQGSSITVDVTNELEVDTTVHWHGLRLENKDDGVPGMTQEAIHPNGSYTYTVVFPDEGIYWYHPHVREDLQQDKGLYGTMLVVSEDPDAYPPVNAEKLLVLDDILTDKNGTPEPHGENEPTHALMGRFGNVYLVNGRTAGTQLLEVARGSVVRFYLANVANTRTFRVQIDGGRMKLVGSDIGRYEREQWVDSVTIAPAERYIVDVLFEDDGEYRISHSSPLASKVLGSVTVTSDEADPSYEKEFSTLGTHDDVIADIDPYRTYFDAEPDKTLHLSIDMSGMNHGMMMQHSDSDGIEWEDAMPAMNEMMSSSSMQWKLVDAETGKENMNIDWNFSVGDIVKIRLINDDNSAHPMQHPFHIHGQRFLVLSDNGTPTEDLVWKDTVLVPTGHTVDILVEMSNIGDWMMHCHIAEHLSNGMMGSFSVSP